MEDKKYKEAKKRVKDIKDFYSHLTIFLVIVIILTIINMTTFIMHSEEGNLWFLFPLCFWGFAVLMHGLRTFVFGRGSSWEKRKIKEVMDKMDEEK
jgi:hypothetical protein